MKLFGDRSVTFKLLMPVVSLMLIVVIALAAIIPGLARDNAQRNAIESAVQTVNQFKVIRGYYTQNVVKKVIAGSSLKPSFNAPDSP